MADLIRTLGTEEFGDPLLDDFRNFLFHAMDKVHGAVPSRVQYDMADYLWRGDSRFRMAMALRGIGKSLLTSFLVPWFVWRDYVRTKGRPEINIMVVSGTHDRADNFSHFCREVFYHVPELEVLIPAQEKRWASSAFDVEGAAPAHGQTVFSRGVFGRMTGDRADLIVFDDIEIPQNAETQGQREKLRRRTAEFLDVLKPGGNIIGLGTPQVEDTIYGAIEGWGFSVRVWPAEYPNEEWLKNHGTRLSPLLAEDLANDPTLVGAPVDPLRFDEAELAVKRSGGRSRYALQYLLDTTLSDLDRFPLRVHDLIVTECTADGAPSQPIWSGSKDHTRSDLPVIGMGGETWQGPIPLKDAPWSKYDFKVLGLDPSGRGKNETALATVGVIGGFSYLLRSEGHIGGYDTATLKAILDAVREDKPNLIVYEDNFGDGMFGALLVRALREAELQVGVEAVKNLTQKEARIIDSLEPVLNQHRLIVTPDVVLDDRPGEGDHGESFRLFNQMTRISRVRGALIYDDRLDALAIAIRYLTDRMHLTQTQVLQDRRDDEDTKRWAQWWEEVLPDGGGLSTTQLRGPNVTSKRSNRPKVGR